MNDQIQTVLAERWTKIEDDEYIASPHPGKVVRLIVGEWTRCQVEIGGTIVKSRTFKTLRKAASWATMWHLWSTVPPKDCHAKAPAHL